MDFRNKPQMKDAKGNVLMPRYSHPKLNVNHNGFAITINENGKVDISSPGKPIEGTDEIEYDKITVPAGLIFKVASLLQMTREVEYVPQTARNAAIPTEG